MATPAQGARYRCPSPAKPGAHIIAPSSKDAPTNPRGIPYAPFVDKVEDYVTTRDDVEPTLKSFQEMISCVPIALPAPRGFSVLTQARQEIPVHAGQYRTPRYWPEGQDSRHPEDAGHGPLPEDEEGAHVYSRRTTRDVTLNWSSPAPTPLRRRSSSTTRSLQRPRFPPPRRSTSGSGYVDTLRRRRRY